MSLLRDLGYTNVCHYPGGLTEWFESEARSPEGLRHIDHLSGSSPVAPGSSPVAQGFSPAKRRPRQTLSAQFIDALADRSVGALFALWLEIVVGCGVVYWLAAWTSPRFALMSGGQPIAGGLRGLLAALYFSAVTATSVGYGDIVPAGAARILAVVEGIAGLILFGCVVSKFVSRRQDELIGQIHRIAFSSAIGAAACRQSRRAAISDRAARSRRPLRPAAQG